MVWRNKAIRRRQRARAALARMLEFQQRKARRLSGEDGDVRRQMEQNSLAVRMLLSKLGSARFPRVLEVGSGAHGLIFCFGAEQGIGVDPLAHHYVALFPRWQKCATTVSACGELLPFADQSFDVVLSDDVVDYAEDPEQIVGEIARVLKPSGFVYLGVNISHPIWNMVACLYDPADFHTTFISLARARAFFKGPLRLIWEEHDIDETRAAIAGRRQNRLRARFKSLFYYKARYQAVAKSQIDDR